jgi:amino acid adenylation domain-containing protein
MTEPLESGKHSADGTAKAASALAELEGLSPEQQALLALWLKKESSASAARQPEEVTLQPLSRSGEAPLSYAQQRLWFLDRLTPGSPIYNVPLAARLDGALDTAALSSALTEVLRRHEVLRTTYPERNGRPVQLIHPPGELTLDITDLSGSTDPEAEAARLTREEARRPFDLAAGPVVRAGLLRLSAESHLLLVTLHHIASDGWSASILLREVAALYAAFASGGASPLPEPELQYADYAAWQQRLVEGGRLDDELAYWRERLRGAEPLRLPGGGSGGRRPGGLYGQRLDAKLVGRLRELGGREGATLFMTLLAGFKALLLRLTGQEDLVVGAPVAGRARLELEEVVGCFVNTLALRTDASGGPSFEELLRRVRETTLGGYAHQGAPFERVVEEAGVAREAGREPLSSAVFVMQNVPREELRLGGLRVRRAGAGGEAGGAKFDLTVTAEEEDLGGVWVSWEHREGVWSEGEAELVSRCYGRLLEGAAARPGAAVRELELLDPQERRRSLEEWQGRAELKPDGRWGDGRGGWRGLVEVVSEAARVRGAALAVADGVRSLSYTELEAASNRAARHLREMGVGAESRVGVVLERGAEMVVWLLAVLKAGGAYVPVEAESPAARRRWVLEDAGVGVVLTQSALVAELTGPDWKVVEVGEAGAEAARLSAEPFECAALDENLAYVIYTSGSTGRPKGVEVSHRGLRNLIRWHQRAFSVTPEDRATQVASVAFDATVWELWPYLTAGASIIMPDEETRRSPERLREWLVSNGVTVTFLPTPLAESVLALEWPAESPLRLMLTGGDQLHHHVSRRLGFELVNNYGPTENTVVATSGVVAFKEDAARMPPIGRPIDNTQVYILDRWSSPVPPGVTGELYIGGQSLARGYHKRAALTAERFVPNPFGDEPGARLYRTGDLARHLPDGEIEFAGRADQQVKIRGFRIELGEIEALLEQHPAVREAVVQAHESARGDKRLAAYVVPAPGSELEVGQLRDYLKERVPGYMLPAGYVFMERLPLTPNGKLDRRALPVPDEAQAGSSEDSRAPRTFVEETLAQMWQDILEVERVGIDDNFFELGGHSLLATRLISLISEAFHVPLPLRAFFESPTVAALAEQIEAAGRAGQGRQLPPLARAPRDGALELSYAQQRLWFLDRLEPDSCVYNVPLAVRLDGRLDLDALRRTLTEVVRRHEVLRTTYPEHDGRPVQVIHPAPELKLEVTDLSNSSDPEVEASRIAEEEARRPFDLAAGPLLRARLVRLEERRHLALLTLHHITSDGWSMGILLREIAALYAAFAAGQGSPLEELTLQYADFAHWQHELLQGGALEGQLDYWRGQLSGVESLQLPTDYARPELQSFRGARRYFTLPPGAGDDIRGLCRSEGVTPFMLLLAAFKTLLSRYTGQEDIVVGTSVANRTSAEAQQMLGCFFNQLALRTRLNGNPTFRETLARVREVVLDAYAHQEIPFEKVLEAVQPERLSSHFPLFQVFFGLDDVLGEDFELPDLTLSVQEVETTVTKFDLILMMKKQAGTVSGVLEYNTDLFRDATVARFLDQFQHLLADVVADPDKELQRVNLATEREAHPLIYAFNDDLGG